MRIYALIVITILTYAIPSYAAPYWDWQLTQPFNLNRDVEVYALDADSVTSDQVKSLNNRGIKTICYVSIGTIEEYRDDKKYFPKQVIGKVYGEWPDERFLDIRKTDILLPIMQTRFQKCKNMGFSAIEPDNMDIHINDSGFDISAQNMVSYIRSLADIAHHMGLEFAQKNVPDLTPFLVDKLDFVMTENCFEDQWCRDITPYITAGKDVLAAEYTTDKHQMHKACNFAKQNNIHMIFKTHDLNQETTNCPP